MVYIKSGPIYTMQISESKQQKKTTGRERKKKNLESMIFYKSTVRLTIAIIYDENQLLGWNI